MNEREEFILDTVRIIRRQNNDNWMKIVHIALLHAPEETKAVMREIARLDDAVRTSWLELAK